MWKYVTYTIILSDTDDTIMSIGEGICTMDRHY